MQSEYLEADLPGNRPTIRECEVLKLMCGESTSGSRGDLGLYLGPWPVITILLFSLRRDPKPAVALATYRGAGVRHPLDLAAQIRGDCDLNARPGTEPSTMCTTISALAGRVDFDDSARNERMFECARHDGNYGLAAIRRGTHEQEKQST